MARVETLKGRLSLLFRLQHSSPQVVRIDQRWSRGAGLAFERGTHTHRRQMTVATNTPANKALVRRFIDEIFPGVPDSVDELLTEDSTPHTWGDMPPSRRPQGSDRPRVAGHSRAKDDGG